jgi:hypothetical protein
MGNGRKALSSFLVAALCFAIFCIGMEIGLRLDQQGGEFVTAPAGWTVGTPRDLRTEKIAYAQAAPAPADLPSPTPVQPVGPAPAQPPAGSTTAGLAATVVALAALVTTFLQGIKTIFPSISGWGAQLIAVLLAIAGAITTAPAGQPPLATAGVAVTAALGAMGIHGLFKTASGNANAPAAH